MGAQSAARIADAFDDAARNYCGLVSGYGAWRSVQRVYILFTICPKSLSSPVIWRDAFVQLTQTRFRLLDLGREKSSILTGASSHNVGGRTSSRVAVAVVRPAVAVRAMAR